MIPLQVALNTPPTEWPDLLPPVYRFRTVLALRALLQVKVFMFACTKNEATIQTQFKD